MVWNAARTSGMVRLNTSCSALEGLNWYGRARFTKISSTVSPNSRRPFLNADHGLVYILDEMMTNPIRLTSASRYAFAAGV